jgi:uncharacterized protein YbjT (DUF2867 family)
MFVVAGVTGHVGAVVASKLLEKSAKVRVIVRDAAKGEPWKARGAEVAVGSLRDRSFLTDALGGAGVQGFFTLLPPDMTPPDMFANQRVTADAIGAAVRAAKVPHVVLLSSVGANLEKGTGPIKGLHYMENVLRETGTKLTAIRAAYFQENVGMSLGAAQAMGIVPSFAPADAPMPMVATRDIGDLAAKSLLAPPPKSEVVDLTGPTYTTRQVAEKLGAALGKKLKVVEIPPPGWREALKQGGMPDHVVDVYIEMYEGFGSGAIRPAGDRLVQGSTPIDETIKSMVP